MRKNAHNQVNRSASASAAAVAAERDALRSENAQLRQIARYYHELLEQAFIQTQMPHNQEQEQEQRQDNPGSEDFRGLFDDWICQLKKQLRDRKWQAGFDADGAGAGAGEGETKTCASQATSKVVAPRAELGD